MILAGMIVTCLSRENFVSNAYPFINLLAWLHPSWSLQEDPPWRCSIKDSDIFRSVLDDKQFNFNKRPLRLFLDCDGRHKRLYNPLPPPASADLVFEVICYRGQTHEDQCVVEKKPCLNKYMQPTTILRVSRKR